MTKKTSEKEFLESLYNELNTYPKTQGWAITHKIKQRINELNICNKSQMVTKNEIYQWRYYY